MIIGLTGGIGSGKTEVSTLFAKLGITVIDADIVAREVVAPNQPAIMAIAEHFGQDILNDDNTLNRSKLRNIIFADPNQKQWLENLLHPIVRDETINQLHQSTSIYTILASPLLLETSQHQLVDRILVVDTDEQHQINRASLRDHNSAEQIKNIMATQMLRSDRNAKADDIIYNNAGLSELNIQVHHLHRKYIALAQSSIK